MPRNKRRDLFPPEIPAWCLVDSAYVLRHPACRDVLREVTRGGASFQAVEVALARLIARGGIHAVEVLRTAGRPAVLAALRAEGLSA